MGIQKGPLKIKGTLGDITFAKTKDGFIVKDKSEVNKERYATDKAYAKFRDNGMEFGRAGKAVKLIRSAFDLQIDYGKDRRLTSRLQKIMMQVVQADPVNPRGMRNVIDGNLGLLQRIEFNIHAALEHTLSVPYSTIVDRATGKLSVAIPAFVPKQRLLQPVGSTHFRIVCAASEIDFEKGTYNTVASDSGLLPIDDNSTVDLHFDQQLPAASALPLFMVLGVQFIEVVNGYEYPLTNDQFNALCLVSVDTV